MQQPIGKHGHGRNPEIFVRNREACADCIMQREIWRYL
jgi:hypothetical protein